MTVYSAKFIINNSTIIIHHTSGFILIGDFCRVSPPVLFVRLLTGAISLVRDLT